MSAVPKKKLCWNCEGNVAKDIDNCPYCGVYLHASELEEENHYWNPSYLSKENKEEVPSPLYHGANTEEQEPIAMQEKGVSALEWTGAISHLKREVFPILFLMAGSTFFLFAIVLLLFSHGGTLTLQWEESNAYYFLTLAGPLFFFGWKFLERK
jgi:hypothetical protein